MVTDESAGDPKKTVGSLEEQLLAYFPDNHSRALTKLPIWYDVDTELLVAAVVNLLSRGELCRYGDRLFRPPVRIGRACWAGNMDRVKLPD